MSTAYKTWVLLCSVLYLYHLAKWCFMYISLFSVLILVAFSPKMCVWALPKWQDTFRLQSRAVLMLSTAQGLADLDAMCLCFCRKLSFCLGLWSACMCEASVFLGLCLCQPFFRTRAWTCICVLPKCRWIISPFCCCLGPSVCHVYASDVIEESHWSPPAIWSWAALGVCLSIHQFILIAQSRDSWIVITIYCTVSPSG